MIRRISDLSLWEAPIKEIVLSPSAMHASQIAAWNCLHFLLAPELICTEVTFGGLCLPPPPRRLVVDLVLITFETFRFSLPAHFSSSPSSVSERIQREQATAQEQQRFNDIKADLASVRALLCWKVDFLCTARNTNESPCSSCVFSKTKCPNCHFLLLPFRFLSNCEAKSLSVTNYWRHQLVCYFLVRTCI